VAVHSGPDVSESDLRLSYDFGNTEKSFGTTNLIPNTSLGIYNNVPSHVTASLTQTSDSYRGSPIWQLSLTPTTATGVSYLTAGNNPGIGVYNGGGGGDAGVYTGHSIFFKPTVAMHSAPIFTNYSNIPGWQSSTNYDDMRDGWYRANVIWYDTVTRTDAKYWAINPASATLNVPIIIYWAAPFKEAQNYNNIVSPYTSSTRGSGSGIVNLVNSTSTGGTLINGPSYNSSNGGSLSFDGTNDYISAPNTSLIHGTSDWSYSAWVNFSAITSLGTIFENGSWTNCILIRFETSGITIYSMSTYWGFFSLSPTLGVWYKLDFVRSGNNILFYLNGSYSQSISFTANIQPSSNLFIGMSQHAPGQCFNGKISQAQVYTRALTAAEVQQNFNTTRGRYGI
jgi:hypothetical protein